MVLQLVGQVRKELPALGTRKLYHVLQPCLKEHNIKLGRDKFFALLARHNLLIKRPRNRQRTTYSYRWFNRFANLTKGWSPTAPGQLWVSDITYLRMGNGFAYLSLITDAYSRKIVGCHVAKTLHAVNTFKALKMALTNELHLQQGIIHHSDRGTQYCSSQYIETLQRHGFNISMTQSGDPLDNSIAERVNGIIKQEFIEYHYLSGIRQAKKVMDKAVNNYNTLRPHQSLNYKTPHQVHSNVNTKPEYFKLVNLYQDLN